MSKVLGHLLKVGLSCGAWGCCLALPAQALTLTEACKSALVNDPFFQSDTYAAQAGREEYNLGLSNILPEVSLSARKMDNRAERDTTYSSSHVIKDYPAYQSQGEGLYFRQPLLNLEKFAAFKGGELQAAIAESRLVAGRQNALLRVTGAYLDAVVARQEVELAVAKKEKVTAQAEQASMSLSNGEATRAEANFMRSGLELALVQKRVADDDRLNAESVLSQLTGREVDVLPEPVFDASQIGQEMEPSIALDKWLELAIANNSDITQKQLAVESGENEIKKYRSSYLPAVDLVANATRNNQDSLVTLNQDVKNHGIGIEINWPLFKGGYYSALIRQTRAKVEQAKQDVAAAKLRAKLDVERQYRGMLTGHLKLDALSQVIKADEEKIKSAELSFKAGVTTLVDICVAQESLSQAKKDYGDALKEFIMARLKLGALTGTLDDELITWAEQYLRVGKSH
ncbi:MAG: TolC family protein [Nitrosomonadales bacterium]|nr:TolC family protein [Nitrosomonadales bacterium]